MTKFKVAALAAASMLAVTQGQAATYVFATGNYASGVTSPNPLLSGDLLQISSGATKYFGVNFTNQSGQVDWTGGSIGLFNGATVTNNSLWRALTDDTIFQSSGGGTFVNTGTFRKDLSAGTTLIQAPFVNSGIIDAVTGTIQFASAGVVFNNGTSFTGAGTNLVGTAAFNGGFSSTNLDLAGGTYTGTAAALTGSADFQSGNLVGSWTVNSGATLNITTASAKYIADSFTNNGTVQWNTGDIGLYNGANTVNNGSWLANSDQQLFQSSGGGTLTNNGLFRKTAGALTYVGAPFVNNGQIDAAVGTIHFASSGIVFNNGTSFTGAGTNLVGTAAFNGGFSSTNLDLAGGTYTGTAAALSGSADFQSGNIVGSWTVNSGATLNITTASAKYIADSFTNNGIVQWNTGDVGLYNGGNTVNNGSWFANSDQQLFQASGGGTLTNNGLFRKTAGTSTNIATPFVNNGQVDAAVGTIFFGSGNLTVNAGASFTGAGINQIANSATFNGGFSSSNVDFTNGTYTGNVAVLNGTADLIGGNFVGTWSIASGATANVIGTTYYADSFTNNGTVAWSNGDIALYAGGTFTNAGTVAITGSNQIFQASGGGTLVNNGLFQKTAGATTTVGAPFVNNGQVDAAAGTTILFNTGNLTVNAGSSFTGAGVNQINNNAVFNGGFSSSNLDFTAGTYTGNSAVLNGSADLISGNFVGTWSVAAGSTANVMGTTYYADNFTNNGTVAWSNGDIALYAGGTFTNVGTINATGDNQFFQASGGGTLVNNGLLIKTGGTAATTIGVPFVNNGVVEADSGTIQLPTNFTNAGTLAGTATLGVSGTLTNNGVVAPGSGSGGAVGTLALSGNYAQGSGGFFDVTFGSNVADLFNISGTAALNGGIRLYCASCTVSAGQVYTVLDSVGDLSGAFATNSASGFNAGFLYTVLYDFNMDRVQIRIDNPGQPPVIPNPNPGGVPEPATWAMLLFGFGAMGSALRRRPRELRVRYA